jgi:hypothetical protein
MAANKVNLDALIERMDFDPGTSTPQSGQYDKIFAQDLIYGRPLYSMLRKPDFQRATYVWDPQKVKDLVLAFTEEELIPALILWRSESNHVFVIDGAHRLSSVIAWVNNDYGIGNISHGFFAGDVFEHEKAAKVAKQLIDEAIGPYKDIEDSFNTPGAQEKYKKIAGGLMQFNLKVQWMTGQGDKAERSFFQINRQGVPLTPTELSLIHSRRCPNSLSARAISMKAAGHPHWQHFQAKYRKETEELASELNDILFKPPILQNTIKSPDLPIAGKANSSNSISLLLEAVNMANGLPIGVELKSKTQAESLVPVDADGSTTVAFLQKTRKLIYRVCNRTTGDDLSSLNLHPLVYFYSDNGKHLPTSFMAVMELMHQFEKNNSFVMFTLVRSRFEDFLLNQRELLNQISRENRGQVKAVHAIKSFLALIVSTLNAGVGLESDKDLLKALMKSFPYLKPLELHPEPITPTGKKFSPAIKNRVFITQKLSEATKCWICNARIPDYGFSYDHKEDLKHQGNSSYDNAGVSHHFCNSAKDAILKAKEKTAKSAEGIG